MEAGFVQNLLLVIGNIVYAGGKFYKFTTERALFQIICPVNTI